MRKVDIGKRAPALRGDAERNRLEIVRAAQELFAERGIDVAMEDIARRAGVGIATLYRRFPSRVDLVAVAFEVKMWAFADGARKALADPDPWRGFCQYVESLCAMQSSDRGFRDVLTMTFPPMGRFEAARRQAYSDFAELIKQAKRAGALREDFVAEDLIIVLMANAGVMAATGKSAPRAPRRLIGYLLQAFAAPARAPLPAPPSAKQVYKALLRLDGSDRAGEPDT